MQILLQQTALSILCLNFGRCISRVYSKIGLRL